MAAFASANLGDVSPNIKGPKCEYSGKACDLYKSSCPAKEGPCFSSGPGQNQFDSCKIIATRLYEGALAILKNSVGREVVGDIKFVHQFIDMPAAKGRYFNPKTKEYQEVSVGRRRYSEEVRL